MIRHLLVAAALCALCLPALAAEPTGAWSTPEGRARVRIADCGGALCATITALREPNDPQGKAKVDIHNADAAKRSRPIVGLSLLSGMKPDGGQWRGQIYNPEDGKTYKAYMTPQGEDRLKIQGCALGGLLCKTQIWNRAE